MRNNPEDLLREAVEECVKRDLPADHILAEVERDILAILFRRNKGNQCKTADDLGVHRNTLSRRIRELGLRVERTRTRDRRERALVR